MKFQIMLSITILLLLAVTTLSSADVERLDDLNGRTASGQTWDFMVFVLQWPSTVCHIWKMEDERNTCAFSKRMDSWKIHGLWPTHVHGRSPQFCARSWTYNKSQIEPLRPELEVEWGNIYAGTSNDIFWGHEWAKHGTCAALDNRIHNEFGYFNAALELAESYNITTILQAASIVPDKSKTFWLQDFRSVIMANLGVTPLFKCYNDKKNHMTLLKGVFMCADRNLKLIECPKNMHSSCPKKNIYYPPIDDATN